jgi:hypothetical protein
MGHPLRRDGGDETGPRAIAGEKTVTNPELLTGIEERAGEVWRERIEKHVLVIVTAEFIRKAHHEV